MASGFSKVDFYARRMGMEARIEEKIVKRGSLGGEFTGVSKGSIEEFWGE